MLYNKNIVLQIIVSNFSNELEMAIYEATKDLDGFELEEIFEQLIDFAEVDDIGNTEVVDYKVDVCDDVNVLHGIIKVDVSLDGYVHWDGENEILDTQNYEFEFEFGFKDKEEKYYDFELEWRK